jgi:hypothetical protein
VNSKIRSVSTRINFGILTAWLLHAAAWFLPVEKDGVRLPNGLPGWEAFRVAFCAIWPYEGSGYSSYSAWYFAVLGTVSAVTTLLFIFGSPWVVVRGRRPLRRASAWIAVSAFIINTHWYVLFGSDRSHLRIGYFSWCLSFAALAFGLFVLRTGGKSTTEPFQVKS